MPIKSVNQFQIIFPNCRRTLGIDTWGRVLAALDEDAAPQLFSDALRSLQKTIQLPGFINDLARLEWAFHQVKEDQDNVLSPVETITINSTLALVPVAWKNLAALIGVDSAEGIPPPALVPAHVMIWRHPETGTVQIREAGDIDLLALKIVAEQIDTREAAAMGDINVGAIHAALDQAVAQGYLLSPGSRIQRPAGSSPQKIQGAESFLSADTFTLQWHITQACDLHCKHCYDRSDRTPMPYDSAVAILDDFYGFCRRMHARGHVSFTGGNPLLYPHFLDIYKAASDLGFGLAILGNPTPIEQIESVIDIAKPAFYQISLEGLAAHNDYIRGENHFQRSLEFLDQLRRLDIHTMVMLTLTRDNLDQVLPLARMLEGRIDAFNFNRLATVGEGAQLSMPSKSDFEAFLRKYEQDADRNAMLGLKDNLINILRNEKGMAPFGGCTGYGCGAAFNFVALLPDGEVHACRKFPSPIGNIFEATLMDIYRCDLAEKYRNGPEACRDCDLNIACRGCLAVAYSLGLNVFKDKDPFCFVTERGAW